MKKLGFAFCIIMLLGITSSIAFAGIVTNEYAFNVDGTVYDVPYGDPIPGNISLGTFPNLGDISLTINGQGDHFVLGFFDFDLFDQAPYFIDETGTANGTPDAKQSYEIGDPFGGIYTDFKVNLLTGTIPADPWDVSMAMGWNFSLNQDQTAEIIFHVSDAPPADPNMFYLLQTDAQTNDVVYLSSELDITTNPVGVPEPSMLVLMLLGVGVTLVAAFKKSA
jgi:hypothetical protein